MEVFIRSLSYSTTREGVTIEIAKILHRDDYLQLWGPVPVNLEVQLHKKGKKPGAYYGGTGRFTVAVESVAKRPPPPPSNNQSPKGILDKLERTPYLDPHVEVERQRRIVEAEANRIPISGIEFG